MLVCDIFQWVGRACLFQDGEGGGYILNSEQLRLQAKRLLVGGIVFEVVGLYYCTHSQFQRLRLVFILSLPILPRCFKRSQLHTALFAFAPFYHHRKTSNSSLSVCVWLTRCQNDRIPGKESRAPTLSFSAPPSHS